MHPRGIIYQSGKSGIAGEVYIAATAAVRFVYSLIRGVGVGLIGFAVIGILFTYGPVVKEEIWYSFGRTERRDFGSLLVDVEAESKTRVQEEAQGWGVSAYFSLVVPKINAASDVIPNVDSADRDEYLEALTRGVAHARGTYFPGQGQNIFMYAHSTDGPWNFSRYNAVFYLLGKLEKRDTIIVYFADRKYVYEVTERRIVSPSDTSWLTQKTNYERLVLQTCYPPGTTWQRLLVLANLTNN